MKFNLNKKYTTISLYVIVVSFILMIIFRVVNSWAETMSALQGVISIVAPFLMGMLIAYFINPMVTSFEKKALVKFRIGKIRIKKRKTRLGIAIFLSYLIFLSIATLLLAIIIPQLGQSVGEFVEELPTQLKLLTERLDAFSFSFGTTTYHLDTSIITSYIEDNLQATVEQLTALIPDIVEVAQTIISGIINLVIAIIVSIYLVSSKESAAVNTKKTIIALFSPKVARDIFDVASYSHKVFSNFFIGKLIDSFIIGILTFIVLAIFNYPFALLLAVIIGITNIIPYFGPLIGGGIGFVLLLLVAPTQALWFVVIVLIIQQFDGNILGPWILGDSVGLSPFWVIFAIIIFGSMFGFIGMFLGAPLLSVIKYMISKPLDAMYNRRTKLALEKVEHHHPID